MTETKKLYYEDSFLQTFTATVLSCRQENDRYAVQPTIPSAREKN